MAVHTQIGCFEVLLLCFISGEAFPQNLTLMFVTSFGRSGFNSSGSVPGALLALDDINKRSNRLTGYNLMYDRIGDSEVMTNMYVVSYVIATTPRPTGPPLH